MFNALACICWKKGSLPYKYRRKDLPGYVYTLSLYYAYNKLILSRYQMSLVNVEYVGIDCQEPQDCFSISVEF